MIVKSTLGPGLVALWERHPDHPDGEVYIADDQPHEVAETRRVRELLNRGVLVDVDVQATQQIAAASPALEAEDETADEKPSQPSHKRGK